MTPYYQEDGQTIYHGDCREILPQLDEVDLVLTDPPYGIGLVTGRLKNCRRNGETVVGDEKEFDSSFLLSLGQLIIWGGK